MVSQISISFLFSNKMSKSKGHIVVPETVPSMLKTYVKGWWIKLFTCIVHISHFYVGRKNFFVKIFSYHFHKLKMPSGHSPTIYFHGRPLIFDAFRTMFQPQLKLVLKKIPKKWSNQSASPKNICVLLLNRWFLLRKHLERRLFCVDWLSFISMLDWPWVFCG